MGQIVVHPTLCRLARGGVHLSARKGRLILVFVDIGYKQKYKGGKKQ